jgi:hypothetical protein
MQSLYCKHFWLQKYYDLFLLNCCEFVTGISCYRIFGVFEKTILSKKHQDCLLIQIKKGKGPVMFLFVLVPHGVKSVPSPPGEKDRRTKVVVRERVANYHYMALFSLVYPLT